MPLNLEENSCWTATTTHESVKTPFLSFLSYSLNQINLFAKLGYISYNCFFPAMRTLMVTDGTLGSVRAMVALGCGLVKRGHKPVLVACPARFRALVEDYGLQWTAFDPTPLSSFTVPSQWPPLYLSI